MHKVEIMDLTDLRFGELKVTGLSHVVAGVSVYWSCVCDCGKYTVAHRGDLFTGTVTSCGCGRTNPQRVLKKKEVKNIVVRSAKRHHSVYAKLEEQNKAAKVVRRKNGSKASEACVLSP